MVSGFYKAPTIKVLLAAAVGLSCIAQASRSAHKLDLDVRMLLFSGQLWRLVTSQLVITGPAELLVISWLLYSFRTFERQMGSSKFVAFVALCNTVATTMQLGLQLSMPYVPAGIANWFGSVSTDTTLSPGPYALVFALFVPFYAKVPKIHPSLVKVCGVSVSDKTLTYLAGLQLLFSNGWLSFIPGFTGIVFGTVFSSDMLSLSSFRFPAPLRNACESVLLPLVASDPPGAVEARRREQERRTLRARRQLQQQQLQALQAQNPALAAAIANATQMGMPGGLGGGGGGGGPLLPPRVAPDPAAVERLMAMGFSQAEVERVLASTQNNEEMAVNMLLSGQ